MIEMKIKLELTTEEALFLKLLVQNRVDGIQNELESEDDFSKVNRKSIWNKLPDLGTLEDLNSTNKRYNK